jgi:hypothetical protein
MMLSFESGSHVVVHSVYPFPFLVDSDMSWGIQYRLCILFMYLVSYRKVEKTSIKRYYFLTIAHSFF